MVKKLENKGKLIVVNKQLPIEHVIWKQKWANLAHMFCVFFIVLEYFVWFGIIDWWIHPSSWVMVFVLVKHNSSKLSRNIDFYNPILHLHECMHMWIFQVLEKGIFQLFISNQFEKKFSLNPRSWTMVISSIISWNGLHNMVKNLL
jgi:hypothetical protein